MLEPTNYETDYSCRQFCLDPRATYAGLKSYRYNHLGMLNFVQFT